MTERYSTGSIRDDLISGNLTPDSLTGMIFSMEGIRNTVVLLNGPMGCKFYHSTTSQYLMMHPILYLAPEEGQEKVPVSYNFLNDWFFRQSRVPCTYLDSYDYVYGTGEKAAEGLRYIREHIDFQMLVIVNSPGASLIGDNLKEIAASVIPDKMTVFLESPGFSQEFYEGHELAMCGLLRQAVIPHWKSGRWTCSRKNADSRPRVNLLGMSIWQRYHQGSVSELKENLSTLGIEVNCVLGSGHEPEELYHLPEADLNLVIYPELGIQTAKLLKEEMGMDYYVCEEPPIGFYALEKLARDLSEYFSISSSGFTEELEKARATAWYYINQIYEMSGRPNGAYYAMEGMCSELQAYVHFLTEYLGMIPESLLLHGDWGQESTDRLKAMLNEYHAAGALDTPMEKSRAEIVFGNANTIARLRTAGHPFCGIEISLPGMGYTDIIPKTHMGIKGSLFLIEQVLNSLISRI